MKDFAECYTVIAEGKVIRQGLQQLGRSPQWRAEELRRQGVGSAEEIFWGVSDGEELELRMIL